MVLVLISQSLLLSQLLHHSHPKTNSDYTCTKYDMFTTLLLPQIPCTFLPELLEILRNNLICYGNLIESGMEFWNDALWDTLQRAQFGQHISAMLERLQCSCVWIRAGGRKIFKTDTRLLIENHYIWYIHSMEFILLGDVKLGLFE